MQAQVQYLESDYKGRMKGRFEERKLHSQLKQAFNICIQLDQEKGLDDSPILMQHVAEERRKEEEGDLYKPDLWEASLFTHTKPGNFAILNHVHNREKSWWPSWTRFLSTFGPITYIAFSVDG